MADAILRPARPPGLPQPGRFGVAAGAAGVRAQFLDGLSICTIQPFRGKRAECAARLRDALRLDLPDAGRSNAAGHVVFAWAGHDAVIATSPDLALERMLCDAVGTTAAIVDQSDARIFLRLSGPKAVATLEKGVAIDLHPREFGPGRVATTQLSHLTVLIRQSDATPSYDVVISRAFAAELWHWLEESAGEYGLELLADRT